MFNQFQTFKDWPTVSSEVEFALKVENIILDYSFFLTAKFQVKIHDSAKKSPTIRIMRSLASANLHEAQQIT